MTVNIPACSTGSQVARKLHYAMGSTLQIGGSIDVFMAAEWTHDANRLSSGQLGLIFVHIARVPGERNVQIAKFAGD